VGMGAGGAVDAMMFERWFGPVSRDLGCGLHAIQDGVP